MASEAAGEVHHHILIAVIVILHHTIRIVARSGYQQAEAGDGSAAGDGETALVVAAAFGQ